MLLNPKTEAYNDRQVELVLFTAGDINFEVTYTDTFIKTHRRLQAEIRRVHPKHNLAQQIVYISRVLRSLQHLPNLSTLRIIYAHGDPDATEVENWYAELYALAKTQRAPPLLSVSTTTYDNTEVEVHI